MVFSFADFVNGDLFQTLAAAAAAFVVCYMLAIRQPLGAFFTGTMIKKGWETD